MFERGFSPSTATRSCHFRRRHVGLRRRRAHRPRPQTGHPGPRPAPHYQHTEIGYNYRLSNVLTAIGRGQLQVLDDRVQRKREIFESYRRALVDLPGIDFMPEAPWGRHNRWLTVITIDPDEFGATREGVRLALEAENIESRPLWKPMHLQPVYRDCEAVGGAVAEELFEKGLCLPSGTAMSEEDQIQVVDGMCQ